MKVFSWSDILNILNSGAEEPFFKKGSGISVGSFDGLHSGHRVLLKRLVNKCALDEYVPGVVTFSRPLPSVKHAFDYSGDISTLNQRLKLFEELGIQFVIIVDFDDSFASMLGSDFLNVLVNVCNMQLLGEGIDFRCGYKGATDVQAIKYWAEKNNIETFFVDSVYYKEGSALEERISSSYIRKMIQKGFFTTVAELLERPYELDFSILNNAGQFTQVLPADGVYRVKSENNEDIRLEIKDGKLLSVPACNLVKF